MIRLLIIVILLCSVPANAAIIPFPYNLTNSSGVNVAGATVQIGGAAGTQYTLTAGAAQAGVNGYLLNSSSATSATGTITYYDQGNGAYTFLYDAAANGEADFRVTFTKVGQVFTNPTINIYFTADSSYVLTALPNASPATSGGLAEVNGANGVTVAATQAYNNTGQTTAQPATVNGYAVNEGPAYLLLVNPSNKLLTNSSNQVDIDLNEAVPDGDTGQTVGGGLLGGWSEGFAKWVISGSAWDTYAADNGVLKAFVLDGSPPGAGGRH